MQYLSTVLAALFAASCFTLSWWNRTKFNRLRGGGRIPEIIYARVWSVRFIFLGVLFIGLAVWAYKNL